VMLIPISEEEGQWDFLDKKTPPNKAVQEI
jgi:hypothetical protein